MRIQLQVKALTILALMLGSLVHGAVPHIHHDHSADHHHVDYTDEHDHEHSHHEDSDHEHGFLAHLIDFHAHDTHVHDSFEADYTFPQVERSVVVFNYFTSETDDYECRKSDQDAPSNQDYREILYDSPCVIGTPLRGPPSIA